MFPQAYEEEAERNKSMTSAREVLLDIRNIAMSVISNSQSGDSRTGRGAARLNSSGGSQNESLPGVRSSLLPNN